MRREHAILTPESVEFVLELAGPVSRLLAVLLDHLLIVAAYLLVLAAAAILGQLIGLLLPGALVAVVILALFLIHFGYFFYFEWRRNGQTPGKRVLGLRVVDDRGLPVDFYQAMVRNLFRIVDVMPILYALGGLTAWLNGQNKRLGDFAARTVVVKVRRRHPPTVLLTSEEKYNTLQEDGALRRRVRARLTPEERDSLLQLCLRRDELELDARQSLFITAAAYLEERLDLAREAYLSEEKFVLNLVAVAVSDDRRPDARRSEAVPVAART